MCNVADKVTRKGNEGTIGEGIDFADPALIAEEQRAKLEKIKRKSEEELAKKRAEAEAYDQEMKDRQYKRLMHLLSQSKTLSSFITKKFKTKKTNADKKVPKRARAEEVESPVSKKRACRTPKQNEEATEKKATVSKSFLIH